MASLAIRLGAAWGGEFVARRGSGEADDFVLLLTKQLLLLGVEEAPWPRREATAHAPTLGGGGGGRGDGDSGGDSGDAERARLEPWVSSWESRPFTFSAALDPLVAIAATNLAAFEHRRRTLEEASEGGAEDDDGNGDGDGGEGGGESGGEDGGAEQADGGREVLSPARSLRLYDPCCGSGTILAAARALGATVVGSDLRPKFVSGVADNLAHVALADGVALFAHDATHALPHDGDTPQQLGRAAQLVVTNPPWGNNIGNVDSGIPIVEQLVAQHRRATFCFIVNSHALTALRAVEGLCVRRHVRLGGIEVVVCRAERQRDRGVSSQSVTSIPVR